MSAPLKLVDLTPGALITWLHVPRGGYGFTTAVPVEVVRVTGKRVRIRVPLLRGGTVERTVTPGSLRWRTPR